ncbi:MAG: glycosyltransferase family 2 protein [Candidatus Falkowbacteria bacterium]
MENEKKNKDLSIIIVSWNVKEKLKENLLALLKSTGDFDFEIFVVDNNSSDGSAEMIKEEFKEVKLIENKENLGFAKANNIATKQARGEFILLLNPDMRVMPDTLFNMIKWMRGNPQARIAGCYLVDENGNTIKHVRRFPTFWDQLAIILKMPHIFPNILNKYLRADFDYEKPYKVDSIRGGFFMIRNNGALLDERYFLWFEEVDFCKQIKKNGGEVWYASVAKCVDYVGQSFNQVRSIKKQKYFRDSMLKYFKKWHPYWQYLILKIVWPVGIFITWILVKLNFKSKAKT